MVRFVFRPFLQIYRTICTSVPLLRQGFSWRCASQPQLAICRVLPRKQNRTHMFIMNRHGRNNIRNGIVGVETSHSTRALVQSTLHVIEPRTHKKIEMVFENKFRDDENRSRICLLIPKNPEIVRISFGGNRSHSMTLAAEPLRRGHGNRRETHPALAHSFAEVNAAQSSAKGATPTPNPQEGGNLRAKLRAPPRREARAK